MQILTEKNKIINRGDKKQGLLLPLFLCYETIEW